jgi:cation diffusion facilitator family transporter
MEFKNSLVKISILKLSLNSEAVLIKVSIVGALFFGLLGTIWGLAITSDAIIFDGFYSFLSTILSIGSFYVTKLVLQKEDDNYHFGKAQIEPVFIVFRSVILITLCAYAIITSISTILDGGKSVLPGQASIYAILSMVGCLIVFLVLKANGKRLNSEIIKIETTQWKVDTILSSGVLVAYVTYWLIKDGKYKFIANYIDPALVIFLSIMVVSIPIKTFKKSIKELFLVAPKDKVEEEFNKIAEHIVKSYEFIAKRVRVVRTGRKYFVEINILVDPSWELKSVSDLDMIRNQFYCQVAKSDLEPWVTFSFTTEAEWL